MARVSRRKQIAAAQGVPVDVLPKAAALRIFRTALYVRLSIMDTARTARACKRRSTICVGISPSTLIWSCTTAIVTTEKPGQILSALDSSG